MFLFCWVFVKFKFLFLLYLFNWCIGNINLFLKRNCHFRVVGKARIQRFCKEAVFHFVLQINLRKLCLYETRRGGGGENEFLEFHF